MANFNKIYPSLIKAEGGYSNNPQDRGGETYKGVARNFHPLWEGWKIVDDYKLKHTLKTNDIIPDTKLDDMIYKFYKKEFWDKVNGDSIKSQEVAHIVFDAYTNQTGWTRKMISDSLSNVGKPTEVKIPLKQDTVSIINSIAPDKFYNEFKKQRKIRYEQEAKEPGQEGFLKGWMNRLSKFDVLETVKKHKGITAAIILGIGALATGIYLFTKK